jgi:hypothetical protein
LHLHTAPEKSGETSHTVCSLRAGQ